MKTNVRPNGPGLLGFPLRPYGASARQVARNDAVCVGPRMRPHAGGGLSSFAERAKNLRNNAVYM